VGRDRAAALQIDGAPTSPVAVMIGKPTLLPPLVVRNVGSLALADLRVELIPDGGPITIANGGCLGKDLPVGETCMVVLTASATSSAAPLVSETLVVSDGDGRSMASVAVSIAAGGLAARLEPDQPLVVAPGCLGAGKIVLSNNGPEATDFQLNSSSPDLAVAPDKASCAVANIAAGGECSLDLSSKALVSPPVPPWTVTIAGTAGGTASVAVPLDILPAISVSPLQATVTASPDGGTGTTTLFVRTGIDGAYVDYLTSTDAALITPTIVVVGCNIVGPRQTIASCATCELTVAARGSGDGTPYSRTITFSDPKNQMVAPVPVVVTVSY
jgi:hypothetical protein